jgi:phage shock protein E
MQLREFGHARRVLALAGVVLVLAAPAAAASEQPVPQPLLLAFLADNSSFTLLDARTPDEYAEAHLTGAVNVPHDAVDDKAAALPGHPGATIVVYCKTGKRAGLLKSELAKRGYTDVRVLLPDQIHWFDGLAVFNCATPPENIPARDLVSLAGGQLEKSP